MKKQCPPLRGGEASAAPLSRFLPHLIVVSVCSSSLQEEEITAVFFLVTMNPPS